MSDEETNSDSEITKRDIRKVLYFILILAGLNLFYFFFIWYNFLILDYALVIALGVLAAAPAYIANASMTLVGGGKPMDGGHNFFDGERIFGDGKTIKGFFGGFIIGTIGGYLLTLFYPLIANFAVKQGFIPPFPWTNYLNLVTPDEVFNIIGYQLFNFENFNIILIFRIPLLSLGGPLGDLAGSFIKRRFKVKRGGQFPLLDQLDFILIAIAISYPLLWLRLHYIIILILLTPLIALLGNWVAYKGGKKSVPW